MTLDEMTYRQTFTLMVKLFLAAVPALLLVLLSVGAIVGVGMLVAAFAFGGL